MRKHVFISYAREDKAYVERLVSAMRSRELPVWSDYAIAPGDRFGRAIVNAIRDSKAFVLVMSPASYESEWVWREIDLAERERVPIFPIVLRGTVFPELADRQYEAVSRRRQPSERWFEMLAARFPARLRSDVISEEEIEGLFHLLAAPRCPQRIAVLDYTEREKAIFLQEIEARFIGLPRLLPVVVDLSYYAHEVGAIPPTVRAILSAVPERYHQLEEYQELMAEYPGMSKERLHVVMEDLFQMIHAQGPTLLVFVNHVEHLFIYRPVAAAVGEYLKEYFGGLNSIFRVPGLTNVLFFDFEVVEQMLRICYSRQGLGLKEKFLTEKFIDGFLNKQALIAVNRDYRKLVSKGQRRKGKKPGS